MSDLTPIFFEIIRHKQEQLDPIDRQQLLQKQKSQKINQTQTHQEDVFTKECLNINNTIKWLRHSIETIRPSYLAASNHGPNKFGRFGSSLNSSSAVATLTEKECEDFDYETRLAIQQTMARIRHLEDLETQRINREKAAFSSGRGFSGFSGFFNSLGDNSIKEQEASKTLALHRAGMLWYLNQGLASVSQQHAKQQEIRVDRQLQKTKNTLHNVSDSARFAPIPSNANTNKNSLSAEAASNSPKFSNLSTFESSGSSYNDLPAELRDLTPQQVQELETENTALFDELELTLNKAKAAEKSLMEISSLQSSLSAHLSTQNEHIQSLLNDSVQVQDDISKANKQLDSAKERNRRASRIIVIVTLTLAFILFFYDALIS